MFGSTSKDRLIRTAIKLGSSGVPATGDIIFEGDVTQNGNTFTFGGGAATVDWGDIGGTLADQLDLQAELDAKYDASNPDGFVADLSTFDTADLTEGSNLYFTVERAQDAVGNSVGTGLAYDDLTGVISSTVSTYTDEQAQDAVGNAVGTGLAYNDGTGAISSTITQYTDELAQDAVGTILDDGGDIDFTYDDGTPKITAAVKSDSVTFAKMQNINTARLLGRSTAATGDVEEIEIGSGLALAAGILSATGGGGSFPDSVPITRQYVAPTGTFTVTIASPGVFTKTAHLLVAGDAIQFTTTGALPTGLTAATTYYVIAAGLTANAFQVSTTVGGSAVNTSGSQSGVHTLTQVWIKDADMLFAIIEVIGAGGGGGGGNRNGAGNGGVGGGGGGGGYAQIKLLASSLGSTELVTVGEGGTAGPGGTSSDAANTGGTGGTTSFGSLAVAAGGAGGVGKATSGSGAGGAGGVPTTGDIKLTGGKGGFGSQYATSPAVNVSGKGGDTVYGYGGQSVASGNTAGTAGDQYGGGGSGGISSSGSTAAAGGVGKSGIIIVHEYY